MNKNRIHKRGVVGEALLKFANLNFRTLRLSSMLLDHMFVTIIVIVPSLLFTILKIEFNTDVDRIFWFASLFLYFNKDVVRGRSVAKRLQGYKVVKLGTDEIASSLQCYLRNIVIPIFWPLEVLITYFNPKRRLGDFLANTEVVSAERIPLRSILDDLSTFKLTLQTVWVIVAGLIFSFFFSNIL